MRVPLAGSGILFASALAACATDDFSSVDAGSDALADAGCSVLYVSQSTGDDRASGCSAATAKKTIGAALATIGTSSTPAAEVRVCKGRYEEHLVVKGVALSGGYECGSFVRPTDYGYPAFNGNTLSEVVRVSAPATGDVSTIELRDGATLDGFSVSAHATTCGAAAVEAAAGAATISNVRALGGAGTGTCVRASIGFLASGGAAKLTSVRLAGGSGSVDGTGRGSAALVVVGAGSAEVTGSVVEGGTGKSSQGTGSVGADVSGKLVIASSSVSGGTGEGDATASDSIAALATAGGKITATATYFHGGSGANCGPTGGCRRTGIGAISGGTVEIRRSRIHAGDAAGAAGVAFAASIDASTNNVFENDDLYGGSSATSNATALLLRNGAGGLVRFNTISTGRPAQGGEQRRAIVLDAPAAAAFEGNLVLGFGSGVVAFAVTCPPANTVTSITENAFGGVTTFLQPLSACGTAAPTLATFEASTILAPLVPSKNVVLKPSCGAETSCIAADPALIHSPFDAATGGGVELSSGWRLASGVACSIASGVSTVANPPDDLLGTKRSPPYSFGAAEQDTCN